MTLDDRLDQVWNDAKNDPLEEAYGFTIKEVRQAILSDLLEIIGEDEHSKARPDKLMQSPPHLRNLLRQELRGGVRKYCE